MNRHNSQLKSMFVSVENYRQQIDSNVSTKLIWTITGKIEVASAAFTFSVGSDKIIISRNQYESNGNQYKMFYKILHNCCVLYKVKNIHRFVQFQTINNISIATRKSLQCKASSKTQRWNVYNSINKSL